jgi:hypothetical protein
MSPGPDHAKQCLTDLLRIKSRLAHEHKLSVGRDLIGGGFTSQISRKRFDVPALT